MILNKTIRKKVAVLAAPLLSLVMAGGFVACQDNVSTVGSDLASSEVQIALDSIIWDGTEQYIQRGDGKILVSCPKISYTTLFDDVIDTRSTTNLLGRISVPEYGDLNCSFVSRMMCTTSLAIPDSIPVEQIDSMKLILRVPRGELTGDSLAPQQLRVFRLTKSLPSDIDNRFDPTGYYDPSNPIGSRSFTLSALGMSDSIYLKLNYIDIDIHMSKEMAVETVNAYRNKATQDIFSWPQSFEQYFHGIYVEPSFGRGCVANIAATKFLIYYNYKVKESSTGSDGTVTSSVKTKTGAVGVFESSPIVLNSNNVIFRPSDNLKNRAADNEAIITTPGGFRVNLRFPGKELVDIYNKSQSKLAVVSDLTFSIPAEEIPNDYGLTPPPYLIMVKSSKLADFLANNSLPNNKDSFYASYNPTYKRYTFSSMRNYIIDLIKSGAKEEDLEFTIIPANLVFEDQSSSSSSSYYNYYYYYYGYGASNTSKAKTLTKCTPYITKPTMCRLMMDQARTIFIYSLQQMQ